MAIRASIILHCFYVWAITIILLGVQREGGILRGRKMNWEPSRMSAVFWKMRRPEGSLNLRLVLQFRVCMPFRYAFTIFVYLWPPRRLFVHRQNRDLHECIFGSGTFALRLFDLQGFSVHLLVVCFAIRCARCMQFENFERMILISDNSEWHLNVVCRLLDQWGVL